MSVPLMPPLPIRRFLRPAYALLGLACLSAGWAAEDRSTADMLRERVLRMTDFLDTMLPGVLEENNITLQFKPKFVDVRAAEYVRFPLELRYGLTDRVELQGGLVPFVPNPFNGGRDHRWGPGEAKLGARFDIGQTLRFFNETTVGFETRVPIGKPPTRFNDHYTHVKPFVSAARQLLRWPSTTLYANVSYDRSVKLTERGPAPPDVTRRHILEFSPGLLFKPSEFGYFAEYRFRHIDEPTESRLAHEIQFGSIWDVPLARSEKLKLPGKWQLELAYHVEHEEGRGDDHGVSARVNWRTTLREVLEHTKVSRLW